VALVESLESLARPALTAMGLELVELQYRRENRGWVLRLIIDKESGITVEDCARVSTEIGNLLEVEELIGHAYTLEVSSPGLDRPLKREADYRRFAGRKARLTIREADGGSRVVTGLIGPVEEEAVRLNTTEGELRVSFDRIVKARLDFDF